MTGNPYQRRISVYPLVDSRGRQVYFLIQRGTDQEPLKNVPVIWSGGPVRAIMPPSDQETLVTPSNGVLRLPEWKDVLVLIVE